jgi:hypothetical protein
LRRRRHWQPTYRFVRCIVYLYNNKKNDFDSHYIHSLQHIRAHGDEGTAGTECPCMRTNVLSTCVRTLLYSIISGVQGVLKSVRSSVYELDSVSNNMRDAQGRVWAESNTAALLLLRIVEEASANDVECEVRRV